MDLPPISFEGLVGPNALQHGLVEKPYILSARLASLPYPSMLQSEAC